MFIDVNRHVAVHLLQLCLLAASFSARLPLSNLMSLSPYGSPMPYGGWALSVAIVFGGFFVASGWSGIAEHGRDSKESTASGTYHTDQEVGLLDSVTIVGTVLKVAMAIAHMVGGGRGVDVMPTLEKSRMTMTRIQLSPPFASLGRVCTRFMRSVYRPCLPLHLLGIGKIHVQHFAGKSPVPPYRVWCS